MLEFLRLIVGLIAINIIIIAKENNLMNSEHNTFSYDKLQQICSF